MRKWSLGSSIEDLLLLLLLRCHIIKLLLLHWLTLQVPVVLLCMLHVSLVIVKCFWISIHAFDMIICRTMEHLLMLIMHWKVTVRLNLFKLAIQSRLGWHGYTRIIQLAILHYSRPCLLLLPKGQTILRIVLHHHVCSINFTTCLLIRVIVANSPYELSLLVRRAVCTFVFSSLPFCLLML